MQQTVQCVCGQLITGHGYWLNLRLNNPLYGCPRCKTIGKQNFRLVKSSPDEVKVMRKNEDGELYHPPGETATKITRYQRDRHNLIKKDLEAGVGISEAKKRARSNKILEK